MNWVRFSPGRETRRRQVLIFLHRFVSLLARPSVGLASFFIGSLPQHWVRFVADEVRERVFDSLQGFARRLGSFRPRRSGAIPRTSEGSKNRPSWFKSENLGDMGNLIFPLLKWLERSDGHGRTLILGSLPRHWVRFVGDNHGVTSQESPQVRPGGLGSFFFEIASFPREVHPLPGEVVISSGQSRFESQPHRGRDE